MRATNRKLFLDVAVLVLLGLTNTYADEFRHAVDPLEGSVGHLHDASSQMPNTGVESELEPLALAGESSLRTVGMAALLNMGSEAQDVWVPRNMVDSVKVSEHRHIAEMSAVAAVDGGLAGVNAVGGAEVPSANPAAQTVKLSEVPLPAAVWSFLFGLLGVLGVKKSKNPREQV